MIEERPLDLARRLLSPAFTERSRSLKQAVKAVLAQQAAKGSVRSGNTLIQLGRLAEIELKERTALTINVARQVLAAENLDTLDTTAQQLKELAETNVASAYAEAWAAIMEPAPIKELQRTNERAVQQIQWQVSQVRSEQQELANADLDLYVRQLHGRPPVVPSRRKRRLAAIVAVDVAGYSASTEDNEAKAIDEVVTLRGTIETLAKAHDGRVFNTAGDGFMLEFAACTDALIAADELAAKCEPKVRIGVHVGDVAGIEGGDVLGHAVNVAARLMQQSLPGIVTVSGDVRRMVRDPIVERLTPRGPARLDKMIETIEIFLLHRTQH